MKSMQFSAVFNGHDGSLGYNQGQKYELTVTSYKGQLAVVPTNAKENGPETVFYGSFFALGSNWTDIRILSHGTDKRNVLTFGERAVRLEFNPGHLTEVDMIKRPFADLIDQMNDLRDKAIVEKNGDKIRLYSEAITNMQGACMWAVMARTWPY